MMLAFALVAFCSAHNWMDMPASRNGNTASTAKPCPTGTNPSDANVLVELNQAFTVSWSTNHGGDHFVKMAPLSAESTIESLTTVSTVANPTDLLVYETFAVDVPSTQVTITDANLPGLYLLQYGWSGYRNCATIQVFEVGGLASYTGETGLGGNPGAITAESMANCNQMCADFMSWCSTYSGEDAYTSNEDCLVKCSTLPMGTEGDVTGNSLQCRWHHLHVEGGSPDVHCPHASYNNTMCAPGEFLPGVTITITSDANTALDIQTEITAVLGAQGYDSATVMVTESADTSSFVVTITFSDSVAGAQEAMDLNTGGVEALLASTALAIDNAVVLSELGTTNGGISANNGANSNIIAAAVTLPMFLIFLGVLMYLFRARLAALLPFRGADSAGLLKASAAFHSCSFLVLCTCIASTTWAVDGSMQYGLFKYCTQANCFPMSSIDPTAAGAVEAAQAFMVFAVLITLTLVVVGALMAGGKLAINPRHTQVYVSLSAFNCISIFLAICLYSAYYYDILSASLKMGWVADVLGCWWVFTIGGLFLDYRIHLNGASTATTK